MKYRDENGDFQDLYFKTGDTLPIGTIVSYGSLTAPTNWLVCDGSAVSRTAYATLFAAIGTSYGSGDGSTTFNLPDLRSRVPVGKSSDAEFDTLGKTGGEKVHTLTIAEMPSHYHKIMGTNVATTVDPQYGSYPALINADKQPNWEVTGNSYAGGGQAHNILQPYQVVCFIIKAADSVGVVGNVTNTQNDSTKDTYSCDYINGIIESGSNANGNYVKFADGTLICYGSLTGTTSSLTDYYSAFNRTDAIAITFPMNFYSNPILTVSTGFAGGTISAIISTGSITTTGANAYGLKPKGINDLNYNILYQAIGKWK